MESEKASSTSVRQTQTYLRHLFQERGLRPKNKMGQNFLVDLNLIDFLVKNAEVTRNDMVLEVGTGTGSLTTALAAEAGAVLTVELDPSLHELVKETLGHNAHIRFVYGDILSGKNQLNPSVLDSLREGLRKFPGNRLKLVANLPYVVATPVISNLLLTDLPFERMVATVQSEIADRLVATPSCKEYGALAILVQSVADVEILRRLPPAVFWPRPKVESAIIRIHPSAAKRAQVGDVQRLRIFLRDLYSHRRKNLRGALASFPGKRWAKAEVDLQLNKLGIDGNRRAETLDRHAHVRLCETFGT